MKITLSSRTLAVLIGIALVVSSVNTYLILSMQRDYSADDSIYSFVVYRDGDVYKAKNQANGLVDYASATASDVISQALAQGNHVYIKSGVYSLTSNVEILNMKDARLASDGAIIAGNGYGIIIKGENYTVSQYNKISGLRIVNGSIRIENSFATTISDIIFENSTKAIELANTNTWTEGTKIDTVHFINCTESIAFRTPSGNGNSSYGSYASTEISRCFFNQIDNSVGINVEVGAEFSDSQLRNSRLWLGEKGRTNQTGLLVDGSMFQTILSGVVFESFAGVPENLYAVVVGKNADPAPIFDVGVSFLGNWTARVHNPSYVWISGIGSVFRRTEEIPIGIGNEYGETVGIHARPLTISSFKPRIQVQGSLSEGETVTVRVRLEFVDNVISESVVKTFSNNTTTWLSDDEMLQLFPSQNVIWAILVDAKSSSSLTSASVKIDIYGIMT